MEDNFKSVCDKLNKLISEKEDGYIEKVNTIMFEDVFSNGGQLYFDRDLYIKYDGNMSKIKYLIRESNDIMFEPTDDPDEHPGVTMKQKKNCCHCCNVEWIDFNKVLTKETFKEITSVSEHAIVVMHHIESDEKNERISFLTSHKTNDGITWTIDNRMYYDYFNWNIVTKYCPLIIND